MNQQSCLLMGAWSGIAYVVLMLIGWWPVAGFIPPPAPSLSAAEIAQIYQQDVFRIRTGMVIVMFGAMFWIPFTAVIAYFISRVEGGVKFLTMTYLLAGYANALLTFYPPLWWLIVSYRPDRGDDLIFLLNDAAWLQFIGGLTIFLPSMAVLGLSILRDNLKTPIFPRWCGYLTLWVLVLLLPGQLIFFFKQGPFTWAGLLAFWVPVSVFCIWILTMSILLMRAIRIHTHDND